MIVKIACHINLPTTIIKAFCLTKTGVWKLLNYCGSGRTLKKEAESELGSIWLFEEPEAEAFFIKHAAGMLKRSWKRLIFVEAEALWRKKLEANSEATNFKRSWKRKTFYCFHISKLQRKL